MKKSKFYLSPKKQSERGNVLIITLITSVVVGVGLLGTATRSRYGERSIARENLARNALDAAEAGSEIILEDLNSQHPYLLVVNNNQWDDPPTYSTLCDTSSSGTPIQSGSVGTSASFELSEYIFNGNPIFGGSAYLRVKGSASNPTNTTTATAILEKKVQIIPKKQDNCSGFPGLGLMVLGAATGAGDFPIDMGNNDIHGTFGNVTCSTCNINIPSNYNCDVNSTTSLTAYTENDKKCVIGGKDNMTVDGDIFIGPIDIPPIPPPPSSLNGIAAATIDSNTTLVSGSTSSSELLDGSCVVENNITHCKVDTINISGGDYFTIDTSSGVPARIYVSGDITVGGNSKIEAEPLTECPTRLGLFGNAADTDDTNDQLVTVNGNAKINNIFLYFPDAKVGVNGGGNVAYTCTNGDCDGGNFHGTIWAKEWGLSNGNKARITVPSNMDQCFTTYFPDLIGFDNFGNTSLVGRGVLSHRTLKSE